LFPLHTVLFPGGRLQLRIFETRYVDLVRRCLRNDEPFGVVLIKAGSETGPAEVFEVGTLADIADWHMGSDGLLGIVARGLSRFEISRSYRDSAGLYNGFVRLLPHEEPQPLDPRFADIARELSQLVEDIPVSEREPGNAIWICYRLAERLQLDNEIKQEILECEGAERRLERMLESLESWMEKAREGS
jgi:Lon protease-like protein